MTRRKKTNTPLEDFAEIVETSPLLRATVTEKLKEDDQLEENDELVISKLDLFALFASIGVAKKIDDVSQIAHTSYQIAFKMSELSEVYKDWKPMTEKK